jgi:hypothetical protein
MASKKKTAVEQQRTTQAPADEVTAVKNAAKALVDQVETATEPQVTISTAEQEAAMRKEATSPAAVKAALAAGKKNPIEKYGDPDAEPVTGAARGY